MASQSPHSGGALRLGRAGGGGPGTSTSWRASSQFIGVSDIVRRQNTSCQWVHGEIGFRALPVAGGLRSLHGRYRKSRCDQIHPGSEAHHQRIDFQTNICACSRQTAWITAENSSLTVQPFGRMRGRLQFSARRGAVSRSRFSYSSADAAINREVETIPRLSSVDFHHALPFRQRILWPSCRGRDPNVDRLIGGCWRCGE